MHLTAGRREKVKAKVYRRTLPYTPDSISLHDDAANALSEFNNNQAVGLSLRFYQFLQSLSSRCVHWPVTSMVSIHVSLPLSFHMYDFLIQGTVVELLLHSTNLHVSQVTICIYCAASVLHMGILMWSCEL